MPPVYLPSVSKSTSTGSGKSQQESQSTNVSSSLSQAGTYIPDYLESPILRQIATYASGMAPQIYQWGMEQFNKNQGNIDTMMRNALSYASPQRIASEMGQAEAGVQQGAEAGRQNAIRDLQSFGVDPSSGRYAALDQASRVMSGAAAAGAGNQQREATVAQGTNMANQAIGQSLANVNTGYGAANAANQFLSTGMQLKFPPLGQTSSTVASGSGQSTSSGTSENTSQSGSENWGPSSYDKPWTPMHGPMMAEGGLIDDGTSPSGGAKVDDVPANLTAGEFVIPKDVAEWKGQEFFYKLMAQARTLRAQMGTQGQTNAGGKQMTGYANGDEEKVRQQPQRPMEEEKYQDGGYQAGGGVLPPVLYGTGAEEFSRPLTPEEWKIISVPPGNFQSGGPVRGTVVTPPSGDGGMLAAARGTVVPPPSGGGMPAIMPARGTVVPPPDYGLPAVSPYATGYRPVYGV